MSISAQITSSRNLKPMFPTEFSRLLVKLSRLLFSAATTH